MTAGISPHAELCAGDGVTASVILVVEDDDAVREVTTAVLESGGYTVRAVSDGPSALTAATAERPALVLLDLSLPVLDGWQVLARMRAADTTLPIILLTGHVLGADRAREAGAAATVLKPFDIDALLSVVASILAAAPSCANRGRGA